MFGAAGGDESETMFVQPEGNFQSLPVFPYISAGYINIFVVRSSYMLAGHI